jgi:phospholipid/cholesterol/gamma-HCH transport system ATP-binding protein
MTAPADTGVTIELRNLRKAFGTQVVLDGITATIAPRRTTVILGPSGTGKSVLLKLIVGLIPPDAGEILLDGRDLTRFSRDEMFAARRRFGMLFQDGALFDSMSVFENIAFPMRRHTRYPESKIRELVDEKLRSVGLKHAGEKYPAELSGGMRKRVGLARAIALDPDVVFFDEPSSGLDPVTASAIDDLILEMQRTRPRTFLVISHDLASTEKIADDIGMLFRGKLVQYGPKAAVLGSREPTVRQFLDRKTDGPIQIV